MGSINEAHQALGMGIPIGNLGGHKKHLVYKPSIPMQKNLQKTLE